MADRLHVGIAGEAIELLGDRAMFWPSRRRLVIADLHLGKGDIFRRAGIAVPSGGSGTDLGRLSALLACTGADALWVLGDMLHGDPGPARWRGDWDAFRAAHPGVAMRVLAGNHDRALHGAQLGVAIDEGAVRDGPFEFRHAPAARSDAHVVCGHVHPVLRLPALRRAFPVFVLDPGLTVLPAFSLFTGGGAVARGPGRRIACVEGGVVDLSLTARPGP